MIITCPACKRRYVVHPSAFYTDTRRVRCVGCNHTWIEKINAEGEAEKPLSAAQWREQKASSPKDNKASWTLFILVLLTLLTGIFFARQQIVDALPQTAPLFKALGLPVSSKTAGLSLKNTAYEVIPSEDTQEFVLQGEIVNVSKMALPSPLARIVLKTKGKCGLKNLLYKYLKQETLQTEREDCTLIEWVEPLGDDQLLPGESKAFKIHKKIEKAYNLTHITDVLVEF